MEMFQVARNIDVKLYPTALNLVFVPTVFILAGPLNCCAWLPIGV